MKHGFQFRYRMGGGSPTVRAYRFQNTETLSRGDMLTCHNGRVALGATQDGELVGVALDTLAGDAATSKISVIADRDAVYAVEDHTARVAGDALDLSGITGAHGVATGSGGGVTLTVVAGSTSEEETLVRISVSDAATLTGGDLNAALARDMVHAVREALGRGPTRTRVFYRDATIVVMMEDTLTAPERALAAGGRADAVAQLRQALQATLRDEMVAAVERRTGRAVVACMSMSNLDPDLLGEVFVLDAPVG